VTFRIPRLAANIERRLLVNYRLDPAVAQSLLPSTLRPQIVDGSAVAGICLIRLGALRPAWLRPSIGWGAENAAHRIAVEWDSSDGVQSGVYVPIRHSASWVPVAVGGRLFPGVHHHARFSTVETRSAVGDLIEVSLDASDAHVLAEVRVTNDWHSSLFDTVDAASAFFQSGAVGWSPSRSGSDLEGLELATTQWRVEPGEAVRVESSFFDALPAGAAKLDCVLVMRKVPVTWSIPRTAQPLKRGAPVV
jgi:Uncharacterized conserved protein (COG2071)